MKHIFLSLCAATVLSAASGDPQSILKEVSNLRQKYDECRARQGEIKGIDPKILAESKDANQKLSIQIREKNGVIKSLEKTMLLRDRAYREANARSKNMTAQLHTQQVTLQEREMLKRALIAAKGELALAQKELKGGSSSIVQMRAQLNAAKEALSQSKTQPSRAAAPEKIVTKVVEPTEKIRALQLQLNAANLVITQLRSTPPKPTMQQPQVIYKDRIVTQEKVVYKERPIEKIVTKTVEPTAKIQALTRELANAQATIANLKKNPSQVIYKDRIVTQEKVVYKDCPVVQEKIVYKDRPVEKIVTKTVEPTAKIQALTRELASAQATIANLKKSPSQVIYKDRIVTQEKVVYKDRPVLQEKIVYKDRLVEKIVTKTVTVEKPTVDDNMQRKMDKLALELERQKTLNMKLLKDANTPQVKRNAAAVPVPSHPVNTPLRTVVKTTPPAVVKTEAAPATNSSNNVKKSPGVYRMASNAAIYNGRNGRAVDTWEARRSFTGSGASDGWIHITGYFVNRVFQAASEDENLWVRENDAIRR